MAMEFPPRCDPANIQFLRPMATGFMARSAVLLSGMLTSALRFPPLFFKCHVRQVSRDRGVGVRRSGQAEAVLHHVPLCRQTLLGPALLQRRPRSERPEHLLQQRDIARRRPVLAQKVCQFGAQQRFNGGQFSAAVQHPGAGQDHSARLVAPGLPGCEARRCGVIFVRPGVECG